MSELTNAEKYLGQFGIDYNTNLIRIEISKTQMGEIMQSYAEHYHKTQSKKYIELIEWLEAECIFGNNKDLSHDFAEILKIKLKQILNN